MKLNMFQKYWLGFADISNSININISAGISISINIDISIRICVWISISISNSINISSGVSININIGIGIGKPACKQTPREEHIQTTTAGAELKKIIAMPRPRSPKCAWLEI